MHRKLAILAVAATGLILIPAMNGQEKDSPSSGKSKTDVEVLKDILTELKLTKSEIATLSSANQNLLAEIKTLKSAIVAQTTEVRRQNDTGTQWIHAYYSPTGNFFPRNRCEIITGSIETLNRNGWEIVSTKEMVQPSSPPNAAPKECFLIRKKQQR